MNRTLGVSFYSNIYQFRLAPISGFQFLVQVLSELDIFTRIGDKYIGYTSSPLRLKLWTIYVILSRLRFRGKAVGTLAGKLGKHSITTDELAED